MNRYRILFADNDENSLEIVAEYLALAGYEVITAGNPAQAKELIRTTRLHLAILDLRLQDDSDETDRSGLRLAKHTVRGLPKLIWTKFPTHEDVREALKPDSYWLPPAVDFVDKHRGIEELLLSVEDVLAKHARFNWDLIFRLEEHQTFSQLAHLITTDMDQPFLSERTAELEDLFRKLFYSSSQLTIGQLITHDGVRVLVPVFAYNADGLETQFIVAFGQQSAITAENQRYEALVPQQLRNSKIGQSEAVETTHFKAVAYSFLGGDLEETEPLRTFYAAAPIDKVLYAVEDLFRVNMNAWYARGREQRRAEEFLAFCQHMADLESKQAAESLAEKIESICEQALSINLARLLFTSHQITLHQANGGVQHYPGPLTLLHRLRVNGGDTPEWGTIVGRLHPDSVLVDQQCRTWLIDFSQAGSGPLLWDFVLLESMVKFDLLDAPDFLPRSELEKQLLWAERLGDNLDDRSLAGDAVRAANVVVTIRHLAATMTACRLRNYQLGLFYAALRYLACFDPSQRYRRRALVPYLHALVSTLLLAELLIDEADLDLPPATVSGFWLDDANQVAWVEGRRVELTPQEFLILQYLHRHAGKLCERRAIVEEGLQEVYDEFDPEQSRLNSAMSRLRQKLETDPGNPRHLQTIRGRGYRLDISSA